MIRKTNFFLVAIDEDMTGHGYNGGDRAPQDVADTIERNFLSAYNPKTIHLGSTTRASNFTKNTLVELDADITIFGTDEVISQETLNILYNAEQPRPE